MSTIFRNQEPLGKQIRMLLLIKVQKEILTTGMLMATNTRPIKAARHLKNGQEGYQLVLGPPARQSRYLSGHATFLLQRCVNQLSKITAILRDCLQSAFSLRSIEFLDGKRLETKKRQNGTACYLVSLKKIRPVHTYPDILNPQLSLCGFKNFHVRTYPDANGTCPSTRIIWHVSGFTLVPKTGYPGNIGNRACARLPSWIQYSR